MNTGLQGLWHERERERLRWTPSYVNSNQLNGVGGDETSLSGGPRERAGRVTFHAFHDSYESYWLVYVKEIVKYDWQIGGGGEHVGVDGAPIISLGQTGKNYKHRLSLFANWIIQHFVSRTSRTRHYSIRCYSFCGKNGKCKLKKWIVIYIYILRIYTDVFLFSFFSTIRRRARFARSLFPAPTHLC